VVLNIKKENEVDILGLLIDYIDNCTDEEYKSLLNDYNITEEVLDFGEAYDNLANSVISDYENSNELERKKLSDRLSKYQRKEDSLEKQNKEKFKFYTKEEIEEIIKSQEKLLYVDNGVDEVIVKYNDIADFIVDFSDKTGHKHNLKIYEYNNPSSNPIATTFGCFLNKCDADFRKKIIDRLVEVQTGGIIKDYKIIDEDLLEQVKEKLVEDRVLIDAGEVLEYRNFIIEQYDIDVGDKNEIMVYIYNKKNVNKHLDKVMLNKINLEKNVKNYIDTNYESLKKKSKRLDKGIER